MSRMIVVPLAHPNRAIEDYRNNRLLEGSSDNVPDEVYSIIG